MNLIETAKIIGLLELSYVNAFSNMDDEKKEAMTQVWALHFKNDDYVQVTRAVQKLCSTNKFIPSIAEIKETMFDMQPLKQKDSGEAWELVRRSARCDYQQAQEQFNKLSQNIQKALGSASFLREIGYASSEEIKFHRKEFESKYEQIIKAEKNDVQSGLLSLEQLNSNNALSYEKALMIEEK